jgi:hypothetical protein
VWAVVTLVIAFFFVVGLVESARLIVFDRAWWNLPGAVLGLTLTYWVGIAAWRCIWAPPEPHSSGPHTGHRVRPNQVTQDP